MFTGFPEETIQFFLDLRFHNQVSYYNDRRDDFRMQVQQPFYAFIDALAPAMQKIDPEMEVRPYKCLARIRRDTRFTKDKSPYRDHLWLSFHRAGAPREQSLFYWFELGVDHMDWGMGFWGENRMALDLLRRKIAANPEQIRGILDSCKLPEHRLLLGGSQFKRMTVPDQVPEDLRPWYLAKELYVQRYGIQQKWAFDDKLTGRVRRDFQTLAPLYRLLRGIVDDLQIDPDDA